MKVNYNTKLHGIELSFDNIPESRTREMMKKNGFRWNHKTKVWYTRDTEQARAFVRSNFADYQESHTKATPAPKKVKTEKKNKYGVVVGDVFSASWGYDQTNVDFFQVIALVGECSVRVREVYPEIIDTKPTCSMAEDRTYKLTKELLPPAPHSVFIKDQENGDLKRIKPGYYKDLTESYERCYFTLSSFADAHKCNSATVTEYVSWYA